MAGPLDSQQGHRTHMKHQPCGMITTFVTDRMPVDGFLFCMECCTTTSIEEFDDVTEKRDDA